MKSFKESDFTKLGLECDFKESFYTESTANVLRGMHFQLPPADHAKLVYCIHGSILDVALDIRVGSPTYGEHELFELRAEWNNAVYLPRGIAHGFYVREAPSLVVYQVTSEHDSSCDTGIRWDSFGAEWPLSSPLISPRDEALTPWQEFDSPFRYERRPVVE